MMLFHTRGNGNSMEEARTMALGGLSLDLTMAFCSSEQEAVTSLPIRRCPVQLDLLPLCPLSQHSAAQSASAEPLSSLTQTSRFPLLAASYRSSKGADQDGFSVAQMHSCSTGAPPRGIDMNQMPSSDDDDADVSSPNSILSPFHAIATAALRPANQIYDLKRERQSFTEYDQELDRGGEATSRGSDDDEEEGEEDEGRTSRKKLRLSKQQAALLEESFKEHSTLNPKQKTALAKKLNLRPRQVEVWFQNRRARSKLKQTETDCELLKHCCESLTEENRRLHKELQELRAMKLPRHCFVAPDLFMPLPAATLTICPSCTSRGSQINTFPAHS